MHILPPALKPGDTIGIIAPAGQLRDRELFYQGIKVLEELGFQVKFPRDLWPGTDYLADTDQNRAEEFNRLWADSEVKALICMRGGYGSLRMLPFIDIKQIKKSPKLLIGFSDITILQNYILEKTGISSLHGPVVTSLGSSDKMTIQLLGQSLMGNFSAMLQEKNIELLHGTSGGQGILFGGNLASLVTLLGTPYDINFNNRLILLEDVGEPIYRIDRMLTQLFYAGKLENISGILLGDFSVNDTDSWSEKIRHHEMVWKRVLELVGQRDIPVLAHISAGHNKYNMPILLGSHLSLLPGEVKITVTPVNRLQ